MKVRGYGLWALCLALAGVAGCGSNVVIVTTTLPNGVEGSSYSALITAEGQTALTWVISSGALPAGLSLDASTGALSGAPAESGTFTFTVQVLDGMPLPGSAEQSFTLTILPKLAVSGDLPAARVDEFYSETILASGGTAPYTYEVVGLPAGLSLSTTTGVISGTPVNSRTLQLQLTVTDNSAPQQTASVLTTLTVKAPMVSITTTSLPDGQEGQAYSATVEAVDGMPGYTWQVGPAVGELPPGLRLERNTGAITGTPTDGSAGSYTFTLTVADSDSPASTASQPFTITIVP